MTNEFNGYEYILVETEEGFDILEQRDAYIQKVRGTHTEEVNNGWVTFIRYFQVNLLESQARIALTREGSLDKAYFTLKEEFKSDGLVDKTSRAQRSELEESCRVIEDNQETPPWVD